LPHEIVRDKFSNLPVLETSHGTFDDRLGQRHLRMGTNGDQQRWTPPRIEAKDLFEHCSSFQKHQRESAFSLPLSGY
jgi:hypothetical protein